MPDLQVKIQRPSLLSRAALALKGFALKAFTLTTLHTSAWFVGLTGGRWGDRTYQTLKARAFSNPFGFRAFDLIAPAFRSVPVMALRDGADGKPAEVPNHPFLDVLAEPSPGVSYGRFMLDVADHLTYGGEVFLWAPESPVTGPNMGRPGEQGLRLIRPDRILKIDYSDEEHEEPSFYRVRHKSGKAERIPAGRVAHLYLYEDPERDGRGWPLAAAAARAVEAMAAGEDWTKGLSEGRGRLPGFFHHKSDRALTDEKYKQLREQTAEVYREHQSDGTPMLLDGDDWGWIPNSASVSDSKVVELEMAAMRKIATANGVMTPLLGDAQNMTYDNLKTAVQALLKQTVLPRLEWFLGELTVRYMDQFGGGELGYNPDAIEELQEDLTAKYARLFQATGRPFLTANEARVELAWDKSKNPLDDVTWVPISVIPVDDAGLGTLPQPNDAEEAVTDPGSDSSAKSLDELVLELTDPTT